MDSTFQGTVWLGAREPRRGVAAGPLLAALLLMTTFAGPAAAEDWPMFGQNAQNTASANGIPGKDVSQLAVKWTFTTAGDVSARAAVAGGVVYFPDWAGNLYAVDAKKGTAVWTHALSDYGLPANTHSRTAPAVDGNVVYLGTQEGAWLLAIDAKKGNLLWKTQLETADPLAIVTTAGVVSDGLLYTGVASLQEGAAANPYFPCCTGRGSVVAVNTKGKDTGKIAWKTYMTPPGYTGAGVWGSNFVVDKDRKSVYVGTGDNYTHPTDAAYVACMAAPGGTPATCSSPDNHVDSIVALDLKTGAVNWAHKFVNWGQQGVKDGSDDWNVACLTPPLTNCPDNSGGNNTGPDYDFASAPNLITYKGPHGKKTILGAGQKSGIYFAIDPDTGAELWHTQVGPGSSLGGMEWGSASDGERIYVAIGNLYGIPSAAGSAGSWAALDPETGAILWQVGDPNGAVDLGPLAVSDGVVWAPSMAGSATAPTMLALDAATGQTLWSFKAGSSVIAGAAIADGVVYWGSGYSHFGAALPQFTANNKFYAFSKKGK